MNDAPADLVHVLLVDDLEQNLLALESVLRRPGLVPLKASSGTAALELLLQHDVALALIDVRMPSMDGFELAELMRGTERTRRIPIIFLTAESGEQQRHFRGYEAGAVDFLCKPIEPHILRSKAEIFFDLYAQRQEVIRQRDELRLATEENARLLAATQAYAEALKEGDQRKDQFLATLAHELRNPLAPLRAGLEVLKLGADSDQAALAREMMDRQLDHMVRLIDDLLDVARISSGKLVLKRTQVTLQSILGVALESSRPFVESARHQLEVALTEEPLYLDADPARLAQVFGNLINNAAKYTPDGGRLCVAAQRDGDEAVIRVSDNGVGISAEMLPCVFDLFTQAGHTLERSQGGLGIGLALVQRLLEMHGGKVMATSAGVGAGSTFEVRLPVTAGTGHSQPGRKAAPEPATPRQRGRRILVVDDNVDAATSLAIMLQLYGQDARVAHDGSEALTTARQFIPELVFLDIGLPGLNGYEVARRFRADPTLQQATLIALTGWGSDEDKRKSHEAGFNHHLTKPVDDVDLRKILDS